MTEAQDGSFVVALEFGGTERVVVAVLQLGVPTHLGLPVMITWPDGSHSDAVELVIQPLTGDEASLIYE